MGVARDRVDHDPLAMQYVLALGDRDIVEQRNRLRLQIVDAEIPARRLVLGKDRDAAARLDSANVLLARRHRPCLLRLLLRLLLLLRRWLLRLLLLPLGLGRIGGGARLGPVEHNELLAFDRRIALHDLHVAGKGRHLFLVPHFKGSRVDLIGWS